MAAPWGARDTGGTIHLYAEHLLPHAEPSAAEANREHVLDDGVVLKDDLSNSVNMAELDVLE